MKLRSSVRTNPVGQSPTKLSPRDAKVSRPKLSRFGSYRGDSVALSAPSGSERAEPMRNLISKISSEIPEGTCYFDKADFERGKLRWRKDKISREYAGRYCASIQGRPAILTSSWIAVFSLPEKLGPGTKSQIGKYFPDINARIPQDDSPAAGVQRGKSHRAPHNAKLSDQTAELSDWLVEMDARDMEKVRSYKNTQMIVSLDDKGRVKSLTSQERNPAKGDIFCLLEGKVKLFDGKDEVLDDKDQEVTLSCEREANDTGQSVIDNNVVKSAGVKIYSNWKTKVPDPLEYGADERSLAPELQPLFERRKDLQTKDKPYKRDFEKLHKAEWEYKKAKDALKEVGDLGGPNEQSAWDLLLDNTRTRKSPKCRELTSLRSDLANTWEALQAAKEKFNAKSDEWEKAKQEMERIEEAVYGSLAAQR